MKNSIFKFSLFSILVMSSCNESFLELTPKTGQVTEAQFFKTKADFDSYIFGAYTELQGWAFASPGIPGTGTINFIAVPGFISQDLLDVSAERKDLGTYMSATNGSIANYWSVLYKVATRANTVLDKVSASPLSQADKDLVEGEARFLRGFSYFMLSRAFGDIPMPLVTYNFSQNSMSCTSMDQVMAQVATDLDAASQKLPEEWDASNTGRATKGAALAYLANTYMYLKDWSKAQQASEALINLGKYGLLPNVRDVFSAKNENTKESIFEIQFRIVDDGALGWGSKPENGNMLDEITAPRNAGNGIATSGGWGEMVLNKQIASIYEADDDRRTELVKIVGESYQGEFMANPYTLPASLTQGDKAAFSTKFWLGPQSGNYSNGQNVSMMRYSEFLLNYAEILFENGNSAGAYDQINKVRLRANASEKTASSDRATFINDLMQERRLELVNEPNLWFHYTRTETAGTFLNENYGITFKSAWNRFPIPQSERDQNPNLCQNEGY